MQELNHISDEIKTLEEMKQLLATAIKQFAKRQMIWFRRDKEIRWLDMNGDPKSQAIQMIDDFLKN